jgi:uncharacterized protein (DUF2236 family)
MLSPLADPLRRAIASRVVDLFNDPARNEQPVGRRTDGLFGPGSAAWAVHGDVTSMMVGGITGLLLQMLLPEVLAGVWDHSGFRADMHGRLKRTARFLALTTYGSREQAADAIARVNAIHSRLAGTLPDGTPYRVGHPAGLAWVHATETVSFLGAYRRLVRPDMSAADQDRYFAEMAQVGEALGADPVPRTHRAAWDLIGSMRGRLRADARSREVAARVLSDERDALVSRPVARLIRQAAIDGLPPWARTLHGLPSPAGARPAVRAGAQGLSRLVGWALAG